MEKNYWWSPPVGVWLKGNVQYQVTNVRQAAEILLKKWPKNPSPAHVKAREMCLDCIEGRCDALDVREAFEEAAREADILAT